VVGAVRGTDYAGHLPRRRGPRWLSVGLSSGLPSSMAIVAARGWRCRARFFAGRRLPRPGRSQGDQVGRCRARVFCPCGFWKAVQLGLAQLEGRRWCARIWASFWVIPLARPLPAEHFPRSPRPVSRRRQLVPRRIERIPPRPINGQAGWGHTASPRSPPSGSLLVRNRPHP